MEHQQALDLSRPLTAITEQQQDEHFDPDDAPIVNGMDTIAPGQGTHRRTLSDPQRKIQAQNRLIQKLQAQLLTAKDALDDSTNDNAELQALLQATVTSMGSDRATIETPGPHRLQPRAPRPEDIEFRDKLQQQREVEQNQQAQQTPTNNNVLGIFQQLAKAMRETNTTDTTEPTKFSGEDHHWDEWNFQLRSYLAAKGWLATYDHPTGPGTPGFDQAINQKLYNKLTMLCTKGTAITYLRKAAEFDGWGAGQQLRLRYYGFSKQRGKTLKTTIENIRHVHGTNITTHIDLFEKLITQISYNDPLHHPSEEQKIDWFLDSITERTYDSVQATCSAENIEGKLTFQKMVKLFTHKCFQRYPDFHIRELVNPKDKSTLTNNSTTIMKRGRHGNGRVRKGPKSTRSTEQRPEGTTSS
jgi:hypothetical protein